MRVIKPYGRSHVEQDPKGNRRVLRPRRGPNEPLDVAEFARSHDRLVIAQWISAIDQIARKPAPGNGPTDEQRAFRDRLGAAAWALLEAKQLLPGLTDPAGREYLVKLWRSKIAPYGEAPYRPARGPSGADRPLPSPKGRWYDRFATGAAVAHVDAAKVADQIYEHLYVAEYRIETNLPSRREGRILGRARSIAVNVPRPRSPPDGPGPDAGWTDDDCDAYERAGNVAAEIRLAAQRREQGADKAGTRRVTTSIAGVVLFRHYARLFAGADGKALSVQSARERLPGLFNLHAAVKDCYSRVLKHHKKDDRTHGNNRRKVSDLLPATMEALYRLVDDKSANRDVNALIRLGKIIHYGASAGADDRTADPVRDWPSNVTGSHFWTSDGQARIKRNEAFVRVWRHVLALASRTLTDWADPRQEINGDILLSGPIAEATGRLFNSVNYGRKIDLLFGNRASFFKNSTDATFERHVLRLALEGVAALRHNSFHFTGLGGFADALTGSRLPLEPEVLGSLQRLWESDVYQRAAQLLRTMGAAYFDHFFTRSQAEGLFAALKVEGSAALPLPRFNRILRRAQNAWKDADDLRLPEAASRVDLENPARSCQYTALKLIYERPFRTWLAARDTVSVNRYVDRAVDRATVAARDLNAGDDEDLKELIVSKAAGLHRLVEGEDIQSFFFSLSAETASEMRVQRGYESDPDNAREQAGYIENLKCDVVALAFAEYLKATAFDFILGLQAATPMPELPLCDLTAIPIPKADASAENWQLVLYFLVHLVPVEEIAKLLHQMRKWEILAGPTSIDDREAAERPTAGRVQKIQSALELYLDMHDAKFEGGAALTGTEAFKALFETEELFTRLFPRQTGDDDDRRIPRRGLREIMRFGHLPVLRSVFMSHPIVAAEIAAFAQAEKLEDGKPVIAHRQARRELLHERWTRNKRNFAGDDLRGYVEGLADVVRHRYVAAHVTLTDHVRLHRLLMTVLGRLVDYAGLWERDLYFVSLALIYEGESRPEQTFTPAGLRFLGQGQIVQALRCLQPETLAFAGQLRWFFGTAFEQGSRLVRMRNDFAHFNMLKSVNLPVDLTVWANGARYLMSYDRKLKNAVSKSIIEILYREGLVLHWTMAPSPSHQLGAATLETRQARHLGNVSLFEKRGRERLGGPPKRLSILENLHSDSFVRMVAALFGSCTARSRRSVIDVVPGAIDWEAGQRRAQPRG